MDARIREVVVDSFAKLPIPGITTTIPLTLTSPALGLTLAIVMALVHVAKIPVASQIAWFYIRIFRDMPLLMQSFVIFFGLSSVGIMTPALPPAVTALLLNVGAYAAKTLRGTIFAIPKGQFEVGLVVNIPYMTTMRRIIPPQASRSAFPALFNSLIALTKGTFLATNIIVVEMFMTAQRIVATYYEPPVLYIEVGLIYLFFCTLLGWLRDYCEKKLNEYP